MLGVWWMQIESIMTSRNFSPAWRQGALAEHRPGMLISQISCAPPFINHPDPASTRNIYSMIPILQAIAKGLNELRAEQNRFTSRDLNNLLACAGPGLTMKVWDND
jgi:hypothetical protein